MSTAGGLADSLYGAPDIDRLFDDPARLQGMLDFEAALARAEARLGVIPAAAAPAIGQCCRAELFDAVEIARAAPLAGNLAIPLVRQLTARVRAADAEAARYVHWGATSQDAIDTGFVLQLRPCLDRLDLDLDRLAAALADQAARHRGTPMPGRTWLQQALPITFGVKAAGWLDALNRHRDRIGELRPRLLVLQFGGAAGTLAALGDRGLDVAQALADELALALPDMPWHAARDRFVELACTLAMLTGTLGKIARDVSLAMQTEVGELREPAGAGRGGSSTMPHKRNPVASAAILAAAARAPGLAATLLAALPQEHERALGGWQAEWSVLPELCRLAGGALRQAVDLACGLEVDAARMAANLDLTQGLLMAEAVQMALGARIGRLAAHGLIEAASRQAVQQGAHLLDILSQDGRVTQHLTRAELERLMQPASYLGQAGAMVDRVLARHRARRPAADS